MKRIATSILILLFVVFSAFNVKAGSADEIYTKIEKGNNSEELYNSMPTEAQKGEIISVKFVLGNISGWKPLSGSSVITWDKDAFEPYEVNGSYYNVLSDNFEEIYYNIDGVDRATVDYTWDNFIAEENEIRFLEVKFKVKNTVKDGVYKIRLIPSETGELSVFGNGVYYNTFASKQPLQYLIGKPKITSNYTTSDLNELGSGSYIIGSYLFTRGGSDEYNGVLTTEYIMLASKSIESNNKADMKVYGKSADGVWKNAITNDPVTMPDELKITNINMKANYAENGVYSDDGDKTILRLVQTSNNKAIINIVNDKEMIHGVATVNNRVATFTVGYYTYSIIITDESVTIDTLDANLANKTLQKRANVTVEDYFNNEYAWLFNESDSTAHYLRSEHTGKYNNGGYQLYLLRAAETTARLCLKGTNDNTCTVDQVIYSNVGKSHHYSGEETTYAFDFDNAAYGINWSSTGIQMICLEETCNTAYLGTYTKEKQLSMQDVFDVWETNQIKYGVTFVDNVDPQHTEYVSPGESLISAGIYYEPYKPGTAFIEWRLNGASFDPDAPINSVLTLEAAYVEIPGAPTLSINPLGEGHDYFNFENDTFYYHFSIELSDDYEGYTVYDYNTETTQTQAVGTVLAGEAVDVAVPAGANKTYYARAYVTINGEKYYGINSDEININPQMYTVSFETFGGTQINGIPVPYGETVEAPDPVPTKKYFAFNGWLYNDQPFDFTTPITGDITLNADWVQDIPIPQIGDSGGSSYYDHSLYLLNEAAYCDKQGGGCNTSHDGYSISKYEIYLENGNNREYVTELAPYEHYEFTVEPNEIRVYVIRVIYGTGTETVPSGYSTEYAIDSTIETPVIGFNTTMSPPTGEYDVYKWIEVTNLADDFGIDCNGNVCQDYKIDGFKLYYYDGEVYNYVTTFDIGDAASVTLNYGEEKHYFVRAYANNSSLTPVLGEISNELVVTAPIPAPSLGISQYEFNDPNVPDRTQPLIYEPEHQGIEFVQYVVFNPNAYKACNNPNDPDDCTYRIDGYEVFEKDGETYTSAGTAFADAVEKDIYIPAGSSKTFVAMAYVLDGNNQKIYSPESNAVTYDLTNPTYTFTVTESPNNSNKVNIRGYINNYELHLFGIKVNNTMYEPGSTIDPGEYLTIDASIMENVDEIVLGLAEPEAADPDNFALEVNATLATD